jgi:hypothetical protein
MLERADWAGATALSFKPSQYPQADLDRFTRGPNARSGDLDGAKGEIEATGARARDAREVQPVLRADRSEEQILAISA